MARRKANTRLNRIGKNGRKGAELGQWSQKRFHIKVAECIANRKLREAQARQ